MMKKFLNLLVIVAILACTAAAVSEADIALIEQWADVAAETRPQLDALPNNGKIMRFQERPQTPGKVGTPEGLHTALIWDTYIRDGDDAKEALTHLATLKLEPPAAALPPIVGDVDQKIIDMAYDLSFKARPVAKGKAPPKKKGGKILKTLSKLKKELKVVLNMEKKKNKKKGKKGGAKGAAKPAAAGAAAPVPAADGSAPAPADGAAAAPAAAAPAAAAPAAAAPADAAAAPADAAAQEAAVEGAAAEKAEADAGGKLAEAAAAEAK